MSENIQISIVVVTHNSAKLIGNCLESLFRECAAIPVETFVVDSASRDGTIALVRSRFPQVDVLISPDNIGFAAGNNRAIPDCRGRYVLLLNPDTIVQEGA